MGLKLAFSDAHLWSGWALAPWPLSPGQRGQIKAHGFDMLCTSSEIPKACPSPNWPSEALQVQVLLE